MIYLTKERGIRLHTALLVQTGGLDGIRDM